MRSGYMMNIGRFTKVPLREIWKHEAIDFTNWLAQDENLELLADTLGITLVSAQTEVSVGSFSLDILAEDDNGHKIIIENQLEPTNHDHLGKLITYASGLGAETIVWVVSQAREEHAQAITWLNEKTNEDANFFLIEIEAWKIDNSDPAPRFNIISKPNEWAKIVKQSSSGTNIVSDLKLKQQDFFNSLREIGTERSKYVKSWQTPRPQHWYNIRIGSSKAKLAALINSKDNYVGVELYVHDDKELFTNLLSQKEQIESRLGFQLEWRELPDKKASRALVRMTGDFKDELIKQELIDWLLDKIDQMAKVLPRYL
jgi:hypothetical protein